MLILVLDFIRSSFNLFISSFNLFFSSVFLFFSSSNKDLRCLFSKSFISQECFKFIISCFRLLFSLLYFKFSLLSILNVSSLILISFFLQIILCLDKLYLELNNLLQKLHVLSVSDTIV